MKGVERFVTVACVCRRLSSSCQPGARFVGLLRTLIIAASDVKKEVSADPLSLNVKKLTRPKLSVSRLARLSFAPTAKGRSPSAASRPPMSERSLFSLRMPSGNILAGLHREQLRMTTATAMNSNLQTGYYVSINCFLRGHLTGAVTNRLACIAIMTSRPGMRSVELGPTFSTWKIWSHLRMEIRKHLQVFGAGWTS